MKVVAPGSILVAGIGNIFLGDDGFGCEVVRDLSSRADLCDAHVVDFGIRGLDLAYALLEPYESVILVDAIMRGDAPGTVYILQPSDSGEADHGDTCFDAHSMDPLQILAMARSFGEISAEVFIVGCEPLDLGDPLEGRMGLSKVMKASVPVAVQTVTELIRRICLENQDPTSKVNAFA